HRAVVVDIEGVDEAKVVDVHRDFRVVDLADRVFDRLAPGGGHAGLQRRAGARGEALRCRAEAEAVHAQGMVAHCAVTPSSSAWRRRAPRSWRATRGSRTSPAPERRA